MCPRLLDRRQQRIIPHICNLLLISAQRRTMDHYHVLLTFQDAPEKVRCVFSDLSESELKDQFLKPYRRGRSFLSGNEVIDAVRIKSVSIIRTDRDSTDELKAIQERSWKEIEQFNRDSSSVVLVSAGRGHNAEDIVEAGADVTSTLISGPPGSADQWTVVSKVINHPWISAIGTGVVVAGIAWWFGWK